MSRVALRLNFRPVSLLQLVIIFLVLSVVMLFVFLNVPMKFGRPESWLVISMCVFSYFLVVSDTVSYIRERKAAVAEKSGKIRLFKKYDRSGALAYNLGIPMDIMPVIVLQFLLFMPAFSMIYLKKIAYAELAGGTEEAFLLAPKDVIILAFLLIMIILCKKTMTTLISIDLDKKVFSMKRFLPHIHEKSIHFENIKRIVVAPKNGGDNWRLVVEQYGGRMDELSESESFSYLQNISKEIGRLMYKETAVESRLFDYAGRDC